MNKHSFKGFYRFQNLENERTCNCLGTLKEQFNIVQKVPNDGVEYEFMISFYEYKNVLDARVEIFDEAFVAFETHADLFAELSKHSSLTPDEIEGILVSLGYINLTKAEVGKDEK